MPVALSQIPSTEIQTMAILRKGTSGEPVKRLQAKLGVATDGEFGSNTEKALKEWQAKNKSSLTPDGIAGPDTVHGDGSL